jgi:hypothetical protein
VLLVARLRERGGDAERRGHSWLPCSRGVPTWRGRLAVEWPGTKLAGLTYKTTAVSWSGCGTVGTVWPASLAVVVGARDDGSREVPTRDEDH